ncbi:MAG: thiamine phosphate synthase [Bacteroidales bacterium]|nr:thiamine phosphate synthase [Bacteroidales bacterium]
MTNKQQIEKFLFITQDIENKTHEMQVYEACRAGVKWIQLRIKDKPFEFWLLTAVNVKKICDSYGAMLIINDHVQIARHVGAAGVHLGQNDMLPHDARKILGENAIIGGTANTFEEVQLHVERGVDYVGLGPFRFTKTKLNLSPVLGLEGYSSILTLCKANNIDVPLMAIGGIEIDDISSILSLGMWGIAISSAISKSDNMEKSASEFIEKIKDF